MDVHSLNNFQIDFVSTLKKELDSLNIQLVNEMVEGKKQFYFFAEIPSKNIKIWIYQDSAEFTNSKEIDSRYESVDYDSLDLLVSDFIANLKAHIVQLSTLNTRP